MAKDLPYFKFFCSEWNDGDITLEDYKTQGVFINVCSYYWSNECDVTEKTLRKKFKSESESINNLFSEGLIKQCVNDDISISFLDEQLTDRKGISNKNSAAGKASAEARKLKKFNENSTSVEITLNEKSTIKKRREEKREEESNTPDDSVAKYKNFISWLNKQLSKKYRGDKKSKAAFDARVKDGYSGNDFAKALAAMMADEHHKESGHKWITPEFLTRVDKLEKFINTESKPAFTPIDWNKYLQ